MTPFQGGNAGSNPAGDANILKKLLRLALSPEGSKRFDKEGTADSVHLLGCIPRSIILTTLACASRFATVNACV